MAFITGQFYEQNKRTEIQIFLCEGGHEDITKPKVLSIVGLSSDGSYYKGDNISIQVNFDEDVIVSNDSKIQLETGSIDRYAITILDRALPISYSATKFKVVTTAVILIIKIINH